MRRVQDDIKACSKPRSSLFMRRVTTLPSGTLMILGFDEEILFPMWLTHKFSFLIYTTFEAYHLRFLNIFCRI
jgi:hypothetical protein